METTEKLAVSFFPGGRWVISGKDKEIITSNTTIADVQSFLNKNGVVPGREKEGFKNAAYFDWLVQITAQTEHKSETGDHLFTDRGSRLTFDRVRVTDDEIRLALVHAQHKFGQPLTLSGNDQVITERMARLADDMGMAISNPEMQPVISAHRALKAAQAPTVAPPISLKKRSVWQKLFELIIN